MSKCRQCTSDATLHRLLRTIAHVFQLRRIRLGVEEPLTLTCVRCAIESFDSRVCALTGLEQYKVITARYVLSGGGPAAADR
mgnify:CR=1 FL=1|jgi:hypothetical protein